MSISSTYELDLTSTHRRTTRRGRRDGRRRWSRPHPGRAPRGGCRTTFRRRTPRRERPVPVVVEEMSTRHGRRRRNVAIIMPRGEWWERGAAPDDDDGRASSWRMNADEAMMKDLPRRYGEFSHFYTILTWEVKPPWSSPLF